MRSNNAHIGDSFYIKGDLTKPLAHSDYSLSRKSLASSLAGQLKMLLILVMIMFTVVEVMIASPVIENQSRPQVLAYEMDTVNMPNSYNFHYNTSDGSSRTEQGRMVDNGKGEAALDVLGAVRWHDEKGNLYEMTYKAGKRGYRTVIKKIF